MELDPRDQRLLALLRNNSRASTSSLARELGISRSTVLDQIGQLPGVAKTTTSIVLTTKVER